MGVANGVAYAALVTVLTTGNPTASTPPPGILFNYASPRRGLEFVSRKIAHGVAKIKLGLVDKLPGEDWMRVKF